MPRRPAAVAPVVFAAAWLLAGCGGPTALPLPKPIPVNGAVLYKGKPQAGVKVTFHPQFGGSGPRYVPSAVTNREGQFQLSTAGSNDAVAAGEYALTFELMRYETTRKTGDDETEVDAWRGKYADPAASAYRVRIKDGENDLGTFRLE